MSTKRVFVVFGATGNQSGSVINAILSDAITAAQFEIHCVTRDSSKPSAAALAEKGVVLVKVNEFPIRYIDFH